MDSSRRLLNSGLHIAVLENDEEYFTEILNSDSVKHLNLNCETPLHLAAKKNDVRKKILNGLINTGSDINSKINGDKRHFIMLRFQNLCLI